jgi:hypothetical protein
MTYRAYRRGDPAPDHRWGEKQIIPDAFVLDPTSKHNEGGPPSHAAYGYFGWIGKTKADIDAFFAAGQSPAGTR